MNRENTKKITVRNLKIGGDAPITVQSMCNTKTDNIEATLAQISGLKTAGCDIVRLAVPDEAAAGALPAIRRGTDMPLVADIHFDYRLALAAAEAGFDKIRINPGNIGSEDKVKLVADACKANGIPIRIGVNSGSVEKALLNKYGPSPQALAESALGHVRLLEKAGFYNICVSAKSSCVSDTVETYRILSEKTAYPLHLGITESGTEYMGLVKSSAGIGAMLLSGLGNTIRVSLTADPVEEVKAGIAILKACGLRHEGVNIVSCPTCGRTCIDLINTAKKVEQMLCFIKTPITVAVMGCAVNGPGEAAHADYGLAGAKGEGVIFKKGQIVKKVPEAQLADELCALVRSEVV